MNSLITKARDLAQAAHREQKRKYTGEPYFNHLEEVANKLQQHRLPDVVVAAGYLHDILEDTPMNLGQLRAHFKRDLLGGDLTRIVWEVTDVSKPEDGNRAARKAKDLEHLRRSTFEGACVKCADLISNTVSIVKYDTNFACIYLPEKRAVLGVLGHALPDLHKEAEATLTDAENFLARREEFLRS